MKDIKIELLDKLDAEISCVHKQLIFLRGIVEGENRANRPSKIYDMEVAQEKTFGDFEKLRQPTKEDKELPRTFKNTTYKSNGIKGHVRQRPNGVYEIRCQVKGHSISVSSKNKQTAQMLFDEQIKARLNLVYENGRQVKKIVHSPKETMDFAVQWYETVKKPSMKEKSLTLMNTLFKYLKRYLDGKRFVDITLMNLQDFINGIINDGHVVMAKHVKVFIGEFINACIASEHMNQNPAKLIKLPTHQPKRGVPLNREEESILLADKEPFHSCFALMLYTGCRIGELFSIRQDGDFLEVLKSKQRKGMPDTWRRIPIVPILKRAGFDIHNVAKTTQPLLTKEFKLLLPAHHPHELRHTFITRAQECGVPREVVSVWVGHTPDKTMTSKVYTHFGDEFMLKEGQKVDY